MTDAAAHIYERLVILRCQAGDDAAFAELISRYSSGLRLFVSKIAGPAVADDLLQETWLVVYRKINSLKNVDAFVAWIYRIARDKAYRELRRRPLERREPDPDPSELAAEEMVVFTAEDAEAIRAALGEIALEHREVLILRFVEDMSYEQIAEVICCPIGTVRSRIYYAKLALRAKLQSTFI